MQCFSDAVSERFQVGFFGDVRIGLTSVGGISDLV